MNQLTLNRIAKVLEKDFRPLVDMSDWAGRPEADTEAAFLSRALAALCVKRLADVSAEVAAHAITDGYGDNGIDALYFDQNADVLYFVQSKWSKDGSKPINGDGTTKFLEGLQLVLSERLERFSPRVQAKEGEIRNALYANRNVRICLVLAHTAVGTMAAPAHRRVADYVDDLNKVSEIASYLEYNQAGIYDIITSESQAPKIQLDISLRDWGVIERPLLAYYGRSHILEVASWWRQHGSALCSRNLRQLIQRSDVNEALSRTLSREPEHFWYFNNGITIICDRIQKKLAGMPKTDLGLFACESVSVVNGAQTVGMIGAALPDPEETDASRAQLSDAWVQVRIISLERSPAGFDRQITQATNFQNAVSRRDFAAMDPIQHRLATEFALDHRKYVYKSGEIEQRSDQGSN